MAEFPDSTNHKDAPSSVLEKLGQPENQTTYIRTPRVIKLSVSFEMNCPQYKEKIEKLAFNISNRGESEIDLVLQTDFASNEQLLQFSNELSTLGSSIRYLSWTINGRFTCDAEGQSQAIGACIMKMIKLYSLNIKVMNPYFSNIGLESLATSLSYLKQLHILQIYCQQLTWVVVEKYQGIEAIIHQIQQLPKLELLIFDEYQSNASLSGGDNSQSRVRNNDMKLASFQRKIDMDYINSAIIKSISNNLLDESLMITHIQLFNRNISNQFLFKIKNAEQIKNIFFNEIFGICFQLPYLTSIIHEFQISATLEAAEKLLERYLNEKRSAIASTLILKEIVSQHIPVNPNLIVIDLLF